MKVPFMGKISAFVQNPPNFNDATFKLVSRVCGGFLALVSLFYIYEMFTDPDFGYQVEWNIFKSMWIGPLYFVGLILAIVYWGRFGHWSRTPLIVTKDRYGNVKKVEEDYDVTEQSFAKIIMPLLGHFVVEPIAYACMIYYPLACVFAIINVLLPYALTLALLAISFIVFMGGRYNGPTQNRFRSIIAILLTVILGLGLLWISISMEQDKSAPVIDQVEIEAVEPIEGDAYNGEETEVLNETEQYYEEDYGVEYGEPGEADELVDAANVVSDTTVPDSTAI